MSDELEVLWDAARMQPRPLRAASWDVRVLHVSSLVFTLGMLAVGLAWNLVASLWRWLWGRS